MDGPRFRQQEQLEISRQARLSREDADPIFYGRYRCERSGLGLMAPTKLSNQLMIVIELEPRAGADLSCEERHIRQPAAIGAGAVKILDLRHAWQTELLKPFDTFNLFLPDGAFEPLADEFGAGLEAGFPDPSRCNLVDPVMLHLARSLAATMDRPAEEDALFASYVIAAMQRRIALSFACGRADKAGSRLSVPQERRVKARMLDDLQARPTLGDLAVLCGMSESHFARAFKRTTGVPPHQWLLGQRIAKARILLKDPAVSISEVALECGFADQSHLTRVFTKQVGATPATWRRSHRD